MAVAGNYGQIQQTRSSIPLSEKVVAQKEALKRNGTDPQLWYELGLAYAEQLLFREANEAMCEAISFAPLLIQAYVKKGEYQLRIGRFDEASGDLSMAVHLDLANAEGWLLYGISLYLAREYHRAWQALEFAVKRCEHGEAKLWYALSLLRAGRSEDSAKIAAEAADCAACAVLSGAMSAEDALEKAKTLDDHERVVLSYVVGDYLDASGKHGEAQEIWKSLTKYTDTCWYGYFEHAVRSALNMDAAVRCVF